MELSDVYKWTRQYTWGINLNKIEWIVLDPDELQKFYYDNYLDFDTWNFATDDLLHRKPVGMHYLSFSQEGPDKRYLLGVCDNKIGKKTIIACVSYVENYKLYINQSVPFTYLCTAEVNKYFRRKGLTRVMFNEFAKVIKPSQHLLSTPESEAGHRCHIFEILKDCLIKSGFEKSITLCDLDFDVYDEEFRNMICNEEMQLKMK